MHDVMLDLETMGSGPTAAIVAIGAVKFEPEAGVLGETFYGVVDLQSSVDVGLGIDPNTVLWWLKQSDAARAAVALPGRPLRDILIEFARWIPAEARVWGNGAAFDNVVLSSAYRACGMPPPWSFRNDRCYRTLCALNADVPLAPPAPTAIAHHARDDAVAQARHLLAIMQAARPQQLNPRSSGQALRSGAMTQSPRR